MLRITSNMLCRYDVYVGPRRSWSPPPLIHKQASSLSKRATKRLRNAVMWLSNVAKRKPVYDASKKKWFSFKLNFITLTLPSVQIHTDKEIHEKVFKEFIRAWKRKSPELLYIYKAETQENGNLHYHLTTDVFIHHKTLRNMWNYYCNKLQYVDRCDYDSPNSTDVHSVKNIKDFEAYMCKYMTKADLYKKELVEYIKVEKNRVEKENDNVCHLHPNYFDLLKRRVKLKHWDCSKPLLAGDCKISCDDWEVLNEYNYAAINAEKSLRFDYAEVIKIKKEIFYKLRNISAVFRESIKRIRAHSRTPEHALTV